MSTGQAGTFWNDWFVRQGHTGWTNPAIYRHDQKVRIRAIESALDAIGFTRGRASGRRALDIGCGTGDVTAALAARGAQVTGYDISSGIIEQARARFRSSPNVTFECANLVEASLPSEPFDVITSVTVLQHQVTDEALDTVLGKLAAALKPTGRLVALEVVLPESAAGALAEEYVRPRTRSEWLTHFARAGLQLESERPYPQAALTALSWLRSGVRRIRPRPIPPPDVEAQEEAPVAGGSVSGSRALAYRAFLAPFVPLDHWLRVPTPLALGTARIMILKPAATA